MGRARGVLAGIIAAALLFALPASANAATTVGSLPNSIVVSAASGVANDITVSEIVPPGFVTITDAGDTVSIPGGTNCTGGGNTATCSTTAPHTIIQIVIVLGNMNDSLTTSGPAPHLPEVVQGGAGDDPKLQGGTAADLFDEESAENGDDVFDGSFGLDEVRYSARTNPVRAVIGTTGNGETALGENDDLGSAPTSGQPIEIVRTGGGADTLGTAVAVSGGAQLVGLAGNDTFLQNAASLPEIISGGNDFDTVDYSARSGAVTVTPGDGMANDGAAGGTEGDDVDANTERVIGGSGGDTLTGDNLSRTLDGGPGGDILQGGTVADVFVGGTGTDTVTYAGRGTTVTADLAGNAGDGEGGPAENDTVGSDVETLVGGNAGDTLTGNNFANTLFGGPGVDTMNLLGGPDVVQAVDFTADTINCTGGGPDSGNVDTSPPETYIGCNTDGDALLDFFDACPAEASSEANGCPLPVVNPPSNTPVTTTPAPTPTAVPVAKKCKKKKSAATAKKCKKRK